MADVKLPYIAWRNGRPRFQPGPRERALGFVNADLKHADGRWFSLDETRGFAEARLAEICSVRASGKKLRQPPARKGRTVEDLLEDFLRSGKFKRDRADEGYAEKTKQDYRKKADVIIFKPQSAADRKAAKEREREEFAQAPAASIKPGAVSNDEDGGFFHYLKRKRGLATARGAIMVLSAAYKWQRKAAGWGLDMNPCVQLDLPKSQPAPVTFSIEEFRAIEIYGDHPAIAEHELVDAAYLALFSGQRPSDVRDYDGVGTSDGVTRLVQSKRGKRVAVPQLPPLLARLAIMAARRKAEGWSCAALIVNRNTGEGFTESVLQHRFEDLRDVIAKGRPDLELAAVPSIAGKSMKHFRKTLGTWMKRAKVPDNQWAAVMGHSLASLPQVMPHYYTPGSDEASEAMATVWQWMQAKGMAG